MRIELLVGPQPRVNLDPPDWTGRRQPDALRVTLKEAQAAVPEFRLAASVAGLPHTVLLIRNVDYLPCGVQFDANGGSLGRGFTVWYERLRGRATAVGFADGRVLVNEMTDVGGHEARWVRTDTCQKVGWTAVGGLWVVWGSHLPAPELRRVAEEVASALPPEDEDAALPAPDPVVTAAEARAEFPGFVLADAFLDAHGAKITLLHRSEAQQPDAVVIEARGLRVYYLPPGSSPLGVPSVCEIEDDRTRVGGQAGLWWRFRGRRVAVSWRAADGGRWRVEGVKDKQDLGRVAEEVAAATR